MKLITLLIISLCSLHSYAEEVAQKIEATTISGDQVILLPNGRWEYTDATKASAAKTIAKQYPENQVCPPDSQGGFFGTRCILPGDKDFNRGSRIGK
ncbi:MAG: hypothetical protein WC733_03260 [Methylophilus sp.]|jgi:hypothetical protein